MLTKRMVLRPLLLALLSNLIQFQASGSGTWTSTGNLSEGRSFFTATLLADGRVLVTGGRSQAGAPVPILSSTELFFPGTGQWSPGASMTRERANHTATLLPDGKVLVAGGLGLETDGFDLVEVPVAASELYDPLTQMWSSSGEMSQPRKGHTATLLADGRVLVVGGESSANSLSSAEIWSPATGQWSFGGSMASSRSAHTATRLPDGRVMVAGGWEIVNNTITTYLAGVEIFDPATGFWSTAESLNTARRQHSATLLTGGQVLVAGGGGKDAPRLSSAELFDPDTGFWTYTGGLNLARRDSSTVLLRDGRVLVTAGSGGRDFQNATNSAEVYDPSTGRWEETSAMVDTRERHLAVTLADGSVLAIGGASLPTAEIFDYSQLVYPQLALGGGFQVILLISNHSDEQWLGSIELDGGMWPAERQWEVSGIDFTGFSSFIILLDPRASGKFVLSSNGPATPGWLEIKGLQDLQFRGGRPSLTSEVSTSFFYNFSSSQQLEDSTGVSPARRVRRVTFPVERSQFINTGLAVRGAGAILTLSLFDDSGQFLQSSSLNLDGARFFDQIFGAVPQDFLGTILVESARPFFITILRQELIPGSSLNFQLTSVPPTVLR